MKFKAELTFITEYAEMPSELIFEIPDDFKSRIENFRQFMKENVGVLSIRTDVNYEVSFVKPEDEQTLEEFRIGNEYFNVDDEDLWYEGFNKYDNGTYFEYRLEEITDENKD